MTLLEADWDSSTSPSVYLQVVGTAAVRDECGDFGPSLINPIITLAPDVLSTYVPPTYAIGSTYTDPNVDYNSEGFVGRAEPLTISDLQCPTFGLGTETRGDGKVHTTVGPPWLPIIIPPREFLTLDPVWQSTCTDLASYYVFRSFAIFDPPIALTPESYLAAPIPADSSPKPQDPPHVPANPTSIYDPPATPLPDLSDPPGSRPESIVLPVGSSPAPQGQPANAAQPAAVPFDPIIKPTPVPDPPGNSPSKSQGGDSSQPGSPGLGSLIIDAVGQSDPESVGTGNAHPTHIIPVPESGISEITVADQILSISRHGLYLSGTSYSPGGPAVTLSGSVLSLVPTFPSQDAPIADNDPPLIPPHQPFTPSVQTVAGHDVVSNTSGVYVAGSSLSPGGSAFTASDTVISLSPAGTLVIGSSSISLQLANPPITTSPPTKFTFADMTVQADEPSGAIVDGITLKLDGSGTAINGKSVSLEHGGTLVVGTNRLILPPAPLEATPSNAFNIDGMTVQVQAQPSSSAVVVDGIVLIPGGSGTEIHGKSVSVQPDGILVIGTDHIILPPPPETTSPDGAFNVDGMTIHFQPLPSSSAAAIIDGITLTPDGPGAKIDGKSISLGQSGTLLFGTEHLVLPPSSTLGLASSSSSSLSNTFELDGGIRVQLQQSGAIVVVAVAVVGHDGSTTALTAGDELGLGTKSTSINGSGAILDTVSENSSSSVVQLQVFESGTAATTAQGRRKRGAYYYCDGWVSCSVLGVAAVMVMMVMGI